MENQYDVGAKEDFDNMTFELGQEVTIFSRNNSLNYEDQQSDIDFYNPGKTEIVFMQELDSENVVVKEGSLSVGDVRFTFQSNSIAAEEDKVTINEKDYKILKITTVRGMSNDEIMYKKAFGKKLPDR